MQGVVFMGNRKVAVQSFADPPSPAWFGQPAAVFSSRQWRQALVGHREDL